MPAQPQIRSPRRPAALLTAALGALLLGGCGQSMPQPKAMAAATTPGAMAMPQVDQNGAVIPFNGSTLPPGSRVTMMMVQAHEGSEMGMTKIAFDSPGTPPQTRDWFLQMLRAHNFKLTAHGANLVGQDAEGTPFRLDLTPGAKGGTSGLLVSG